MFLGCSQFCPGFAELGDELLLHGFLLLLDCGQLFLQGGKFSGGQCFGVVGGFLVVLIDRGRPCFDLGVEFGAAGRRSAASSSR